MSWQLYGMNFMAQDHVRRRMAVLRRIGSHHFRESIEFNDLLDGQHMGISSGVILKARFHRSSRFADAIRGEFVATRKLNARLDYEMIGKFQREMRVIGWAHDLVQLFARADADNLVR